MLWGSFTSKDLGHLGRATKGKKHLKHENMKRSWDVLTYARYPLVNIQKIKKLMGKDGKRKANMGSPSHGKVRGIWGPSHAEVHICLVKSPNEVKSD